MTLLAKGQVAGLTEKSAQAAGSQKFYCGAAWDGDVDLDLIAVPVAGNGTVDTHDVCYFQRLECFDGAIKHSGDALSGDASDGKGGVDDGDDESLVLKLDELAAGVAAVVIGIVAYNVQDMSAAKNTKFVIRDGDSAEAPELYTMPMADDDVEGETVLVACTLQRGPSGWNVTSKSVFRTDFGNQMAAVHGLVQIASQYVSLGQAPAEGQTATG